jgi:hypothetical protein
MHGYIDFFKQDYKLALLGEKVNIASNIVQVMKEEGGLFFELDGDGWGGLKFWIKKQGNK